MFRSKSSLVRLVVSSQGRMFQNTSNLREQLTILVDCFNLSKFYGCTTQAILTCGQWFYVSNSRVCMQTTTKKSVCSQTPSLKETMPEDMNWFLHEVIIYKSPEKLKLYSSELYQTYLQFMHWNKGFACLLAKTKRQHGSFTQDLTLWGVENCTSDKSANIRKSRV